MTSSLPQTITLKKHANFLKFEISTGQKLQKLDYIIHPDFYAVTMYLRADYDLQAGLLTEGSHLFHNRRLNTASCTCCSKENN